MNSYLFFLALITILNSFCQANVIFKNPTVPSVGSIFVANLNGTSISGNCLLTLSHHLYEGKLQWPCQNQLAVARPIFAPPNQVFSFGTIFSATIRWGYWPAYSSFNVIGDGVLHVFRSSEEQDNDLPISVMINGDIFANLYYPEEWTSSVKDGDWVDIFNSFSDLSGAWLEYPNKLYGYSNASMKILNS